MLRLYWMVGGSKKEREGGREKVEWRDAIKKIGRMGAV